MKQAPNELEEPKNTAPSDLNLVRVYGKREAPLSVVEAAKALFLRAHETVTECAHCGATPDEVGRGQWKQHLLDCEKIAQGVERAQRARALAQEIEASAPKDAKWPDDR